MVQLWLDNKARRCRGRWLESMSSELGKGFIDAKQGKQEDSEAWRASNQDTEFMVSERNGRGTWSACSFPGNLLPVTDPASLLLSSL